MKKMIRYSNFDGEKLEVVYRETCLGEINYHTAVGWVFIDYEIAPYHWFKNPDLDFLMTEIEAYFGSFLLDNSGLFNNVEQKKAAF